MIVGLAGLYEKEKYIIFIVRCSAYIWMWKQETGYGLLEGFEG